jgi:ATPase subunit of ABC transporter with duplicated ATPase domains
MVADDVELMQLTVELQQLEKMQDEGQMVEKPFERKPLKFRFPELERSGRTAVEIKKLGFRYDDKVCISFEIEILYLCELF